MNVLIADKFREGRIDGLGFGRTAVSQPDPPRRNCQKIREVDPTSSSSGKKVNAEALKQAPRSSATGPARHRHH
jgi:hypothetical protein